MEIILVIVLMALFAIAALIVWAAESGVLFIILAAAIIVAIVIAKDNSNTFECISTVKVINAEQIIGNRTVQSGHSISTSGNMRVYYRNERYHAGTMFEFRITYSDGKSPKIVKARSGSEKCERLMSWAQLTTTREESEAKARADAEKQTVATQRDGKQQALPQAERLKTEKWYVDAEFEVSTNEIGLIINNQTCRMERDSDKLSCTVNMNIIYDGAAKGIRNRRIACAFIDKDGRMIDVMHEFHNLDASGSALISINFWRSIEGEPRKIIVSVENCA